MKNRLESSEFWKNVTIILSIFIGGLFAYFKWIATSEVENAQEQLKILQLKSAMNDYVIVRITAEQVTGLEENSKFIVGEVEFQSTGNSPLTIVDLEGIPVAAARMDYDMNRIDSQNCEEYIELLKRENSTEDDPPVLWDKCDPVTFKSVRPYYIGDHLHLQGMVILRPGQPLSYPYLIQVESPGIYSVSFEAPQPPNVHQSIAKGIEETDAGSSAYAEHAIKKYIDDLKVSGQTIVIVR